MRIQDGRHVSVVADDDEGMIFVEEVHEGSVWALNAGQARKLSSLLRKEADRLERSSLYRSGSRA